MTPTWMLDLLAAVMLVVAAVSAARLVAARPWRPGSFVIDVDVAHLLMGIAMAGMLAPSLTTLPNTAWEVIFGVMIAWFAFRVVSDARVNGVRSLAGGHCAPHLVHSAAMLYMFLAMTSGSMAGMAGMSGGSSAMLSVSDPTLAFVFALVLIGYSVWDLDQLSGRRYSTASARVSLAGAGAGAGVPAMAAAGEDTTGASPGSSPAGGPAAVAGGSVAGGAAGKFLLSPAVTVGCRVTMGVVMAFMLLIAI
jgi:hypothetical protein